MGTTSGPMRSGAGARPEVGKAAAEETVDVIEEALDGGRLAAIAPKPVGKLRMLGIAAPQRLPGELAKYPTVREQGLDVVTPNSYTVLVPLGLQQAQIDFWMKALDKVLEDEDFKKDLALNFWVPQPIRYPDTVKWMQDDYDENRAILSELGMLQ